MFLAVGIIVAIVAIIGGTILAGNMNVIVSVWLLGRTIPATSLALVMINSFIVGVVFTLVITIVSEVKLRRVLRGKEKKIKRLTEELGAIRNLPLEEVKSEP